MKKMLVVAALLCRVLTAHANPIPVLQCVGTEPFWGVKTDAKGFLSMSRGDKGKTFYAKTSVQVARGFGADYAFQIKAQNKSKRVLRLNVVQTACSDGMSDITYPYRAMVEVANVLYAGCCR